MCHLLLLEDELYLREIFRLAIQMARPNAKLHEFRDSDSALAFIQKSWDMIDLYILDIRIPGKLNGLELAQNIRTYDKKTPIILSSAFSKISQFELDFYNFEWMPKPWELATVTDKVLALNK